MPTPAQFCSLWLAENVRKLCGYRFPRLGPLAFRAVMNALPPEPVVQLAPGTFARLDLTEEVQRTTYWRGTSFEHPTLPILSEWAQEPGSIFFDLGSNYGFFTWMLTSQATALESHCFEPHPRTYARLALIKGMNPNRRIHLWPLGLGDTEGCLTLRHGGENSGASTFSENPKITASEIFDVRITTFDRWRELQNLPLPDHPAWVAKIDVEGFEMKLLRGMEATLRARAFRGLAIEITADTLRCSGSSPEEVRAFLRDVGYVSLAEASDTCRYPLTATVNEFFRPAA